MKSKTSFFNKTIFWKNVTLYWPVWGIYTLILLWMLPFRIWYNMQMERNNPYGSFGGGEPINIIFSAIAPQAYAVLIALTAVVAGMALFNYLYKSKSANMIHSLPVDRKQLFGTNVLSGWAFLLVPQLVSFVLAVMVCLSEGIPHIEYLGCWLLVSAATALIAFGIVTFCAFLTGQLVTLPIFVAIANYGIVAFVGILEFMTDICAYGVSSGRLLAEDIFIWFSPILCYMRKVDIVNAFDDSHNKIIGITYEGIPCILVYLVVAIGLYGLSFLIYRRRQIESAGDLVTVPILKPFFRLGVGLVGGFYGSLFLTNIFGGIYMNIPPLGMLILVLLVGVVCYFAADMLIHKNFRVFKKANWKRCGIFCILVILFFGGIFAYTKMEERRIPDFDELVSVELRGSFGELELRDEDMQQVLDIHEKILADIDYYSEWWENERWDDSEENVHHIWIRYKLKDGSSFGRSYDIPNDKVGGEVLTMVREIVESPEYLMQGIFGRYYDSPIEFIYGNVEVMVREEDERLPEDAHYTSFDLSPAQCRLLFDAALADMEAGTLAKYNMDDYEKGAENSGRRCGFRLEYRVQEDDRSDVSGWQEASRPYENIRVGFGGDCKNIMDALSTVLESHLVDVDDIVWE